MTRLACHRNSLFASLTCAAAIALAVQFPTVRAQQTSETSEFTILARGFAVGTETVSLTQSTDGWMISATNSVGPPIDFTTTKFQLRYTSDWQPVSLSVEGMQANQLFMLSSTFTSTTAKTEAMQQGQKVSVTHQVSPGTIVLPNGFYAPYEALAEKLSSAAVGTSFKVYVAPQGELSATVTKIVPHRLTTATETLDLREFDVSFANPRAPLVAEVWVDSHHRLARLAIPSAWTVVIRRDISSPMTREETITRPGDEKVFIAGLGFDIAGTLSAPRGQTGRTAAVVLIGGAGREDRDEQHAGIPVFGQLAGALADAGFAVVRYDKRGVGLSGGRMESATLEDYADDALAVVEWLRKRPDIDPDRVALVGYAEGGAMALSAASRQKHMAAVCLLAAPGQTGRDVTLQQQAHALERSGEPEAARRAKADLERKIVDAVITGKDWLGIPPDIQHQADTAWFKTWLTFDPARVMTRVKQPVLIVGGSLDTQFPPAQSDRLETLARARKKLPETATRKTIVPGVNHLLVPAATGEEDEYPSLTGATVSPSVSSAIASWLQTALPPKKVK